MEKQEKPLKTVKKLARSTTINVVTQLTEGARCHALSPTSLVSQTHIPITAFVVVGSKYNVQQTECLFLV